MHLLVHAVLAYGCIARCTNRQATGLELGMAGLVQTLTESLDIDGTYDCVLPDIGRTKCSEDEV